MAAYTINTNAAQETILDRIMSMLERIRIGMNAVPPRFTEDPTGGLAVSNTKEELLRKIIIQRVPELRAQVRSFENDEMYRALQSADEAQIANVRAALGLNQ